MNTIDLIWLALLQGVTEFLPISSSGHLALYSLLTGAPDQGPSIDVALHVGTLAAVMIFFRRDVARLARGGRDIAAGRRSAEAGLALLLALATLPLVVAGLALSESGLVLRLRALEVIGWTTIVFGVLLGLADRMAPRLRTAEDWTARHALLMGLAQVCALVPGVSRSGVTITAARALGYTRVEAARLAMLMSMPAILAAGGKTSLDLAREGDWALGADAAIAAALAFLAALATLALFLRMLSRFSMDAFVVYRIAMGAVLLWIAYA